MNQVSNNELDAYLQRLKEKDPLWDIKVEMGRLLMTPLDVLTVEQKQRLTELKSLLNDQL